jgi:hypothetical protein
MTIGGIINYKMEELLIDLSNCSIPTKGINSTLSGIIIMIDFDINIDKNI